MLKPRENKINQPVLNSIYLVLNVLIFNPHLKSISLKNMNSDVDKLFLIKNKLEEVSLDLVWDLELDVTPIPVLKILNTFMDQESINLCQWFVLLPQIMVFSESMMNSMSWLEKEDNVTMKTNMLNNKPKLPMVTILGQFNSWINFSLDTFLSSIKLWTTRKEMIGKKLLLKK